MRLRAALLPVALALSVAGCGGQTTDNNQPSAPTRGPCPASHDLVNGRCVMREIYFPGGTFTMGRGYCPHANALATPPSYDCPLADKPHDVTLKPFYVDATVWSYSDPKDLPNPDDTCTPDSVCRPEIAGPVSPQDVADFQTFCQARGMRLLTEAEWEYIATGGGTRTYPWGDQKPSCARANINPEHCHLRWPTQPGSHTAQVASYPPTSEGVYDLAGNVAELVAPSPSAYIDGYTAVPAHTPPCNGATGACCGSTPNAWCNGEQLFPARGGSESGPHDHLRSAYRNVAISSEGNTSQGYVSSTGDGGGYSFRCARDTQ